MYNTHPFIWAKKFRKKKAISSPPVLYMIHTDFLEFVAGKIFICSTFYPSCLDFESKLKQFNFIGQHDFRC